MPQPPRQLAASIILALSLTGLADAQCAPSDVGLDCTPAASLVGSPIAIYSCDGNVEVFHGGIDQVFGPDAGPTLVLDGDSWGITGTATGGSTGTLGDWTFVGVTPTATGYVDQMTLVPTGALPGESVDFTQTIDYTDGQEYFRIFFAVTNNTSVTFSDVRMIFASDTYANGTDACDTGEESFVTPPLSDTVGLRDLGPPETFVGMSAFPMTGDPSVAGVQYYTEAYTTVWNQVRTQALPSTINPTTFDQGVAMAYLKNGSLLPGQSWNSEMWWVFDYPANLLALSLDETCLPCAYAGEPWSQQLTATGGLPPLSFSAVTPLPPGIALDPMTGELSGTLLVAGTHPFTVRVTDSDVSTPRTANRNFVLDGTCVRGCAVSLCGDCDGDGRVTVLDAHRASTHAVGLSTFASQVLFNNCNVAGLRSPDPSAIVGVTDALAVARQCVGLETLSCCPPDKLERDLGCGESYCGEFTIGGAPADLADPATTHYFALPAAPPGRAYALGLTGSGEIDLYVGAVGTGRGDGIAGNYAYSSTNPGAMENVLIDGSTVPFSAPAYAGSDIAIAVKALTAGSYSLTVDCTCMPVDITGVGTATGDTSTTIDSTAGSCGGSGGPDLAFSYDVLVGGATLTISTDNPGTIDDTVLHVTTDPCAGAYTEVACDDNGGTGTTSTIQLLFAPAGTYTIFVDSAGAGGPFELTVTETLPTGCTGVLEGTIPGSGPFPYVQSGDTTGADDTTTPACSGGGGDHIYSFTPASTGTYQIDTCSGTAWDTVLQVRQLDCQTGLSVGCNDDACGTQSSLSLVLNAGVEYFLIVDGYLGATGPYDLTITAPALCGATVDANLGSLAAPFTIGNDTSLADVSYTPACGGGSGPDHILSWIPPVSGVFDVDTCGSAFDTILEVLSSDCLAGAPLGCNDDGAMCAPHSELPGLAFTAGTTYYFRISGYGGASGAYALTVTPVGGGGSCTIEGVVTSLPATVTDTTAGADDTFAITCAGGGGPDHAYEFTPTLTTTYSFSLCGGGTSYDSALSIWQGDCATGTQLTCLDDACGLQTEILGYPLTAGVTYTIVVDGYNGATGPYQLDISTP